MWETTRGPEQRGLRQLRLDMHDLFDRCLNGEEWMGSYVARPLRSLQRELDELFADFFGSDWSGMAGSEEGEPPKYYKIKVRLPDASPKNVEVKVVGNVLGVRGERTASGQATGSRFARTFVLPEGVDPAGMKATLTHDILEVCLPASPKSAGKAARVTVGEGVAPNSASTSSPALNGTQTGGGPVGTRR